MALGGATLAGVWRGSLQSEKDDHEITAKNSTNVSHFLTLSDLDLKDVGLTNEV